MSSAAARMPRPTVVRVMNQPSPIRDTKVSAMVSTLMLVKVMAPSESCQAPFSQSGSGKFLGEEVKIRMPRFSRM